MVKRARLVIVLITSFLLTASFFSIQNNHHKIALEYIEHTLRLKVLQALYPDHNYTKDNYTSFKFLDPISDYSNERFEKYKEFDLEPDYVRENATFFSLARNEELYSLLQSIRYVEERFNRRYHYDWIFANDEEFTQDFKDEVSNLVSGKSTFVTIPREYWSYPDYIDQDKAAQTRDFMKKKGIKYGGSESYRHMCRFNSGFFYKLKAFEGIKYYWRVEPDIKFTCDIDRDYFRFMRENGLKYGWTMALHEISETVNGLFTATKEYFRELHPDYISPDNQIEFITQDNEESFNMCHYWSNFEVGDLDFLRSKEYEGYFQHLDQKGGFFYERWGDAPIHTLAASYMLNKSEVHYFENTGYYHVPHTQCPRTPDSRDQLHCTCQLGSDFNWGSRDSCLPYWIETRDEEKPSYAPNVVYYTRRVKKQRDKRDQNTFESVTEHKSSLETAPERQAFRI